MDWCLVVGFKRERERHLNLGNLCMQMNSIIEGIGDESYKLRR